jgi:hypothetical protein
MKIKSTELNRQVANAVSTYWSTRLSQTAKQASAGQRDQGARSAVTGGAQMDGFISLISGLILKAGIKQEHIFHNKSLELPGFFRATKEWDLLVVKDGQLVLALETKSQVGPSFGNNFNNRTEEAMGSALDLWTAYREGAFNKSIRPWLGYIFLLEDCESSRKPVKLKEPHFKVFPEFNNSSYAERYELFCRKLVRERHYNTAAFLTSSQATGIKGKFREPSEDLAFLQFAKSLISQVSAYSG